jgi:hypothetical protein
MAVKKNKFAFWPELIGKTELTDVDVDEVSIAQPPANQHSRVVMMKSLAFNFTPLRIEKAGEADPSWPDEDPMDDATDTDMDFTERVTRKREKAMMKMLKKIRKASRDFSDGQSGGRSFSESDRPGTSQDTRDPTEHADDTLAIIRTMESNPPIAAENWRTYADRVFGDAVQGFTSDELAAARKAFAEIRDNVRLQKSLGDGLNELAYQMRLESGNKLSFQKCFTEVCKARPDLYLASKGTPVLTGTIANGAIDQFESSRQRKRVLKGAADPDDMSPTEAAQYLSDAADDVQNANPQWNRTTALLHACSANPSIYHRSKQQS